MRAFLLGCLAYAIVHCAVYAAEAAQAHYAHAQHCRDYAAMENAQLNMCHGIASDLQDMPANCIILIHQRRLTIDSHTTMRPDWESCDE